MVFKTPSERSCQAIIVGESALAFMADLLVAQECARPVLPVTMLLELYFVSRIWHFGCNRAASLRATAC